MDKDFAIGVVATPTNLNVLSKKPAYLLSLSDNKKVVNFITLDKPELLNGFISVKGMFCESTQEEIIKNFSDILTNVQKELVLEMMFPHHRVLSIRSLVFRSK